MKLPKKWLCEYVDLHVSNAEFVEKMMWRGFECAGVEKELAGVEGVVVGRVLSVAKHENSDHLHICQVDIGSEICTIVTGADNMAAGDFVPVALHDSHLPANPMLPVVAWAMHGASVTDPASWCRRCWVYARAHPTPCQRAACGQ